MNDIKIKPNYSFWRHPIKWLRERRMRKFMEVMMNHQWKDPSFRKEFSKEVLNKILRGHETIQ